MITAKHYVRIAGRMFTPGEVIDLPIPDGKLERLLRLGAIEQTETAGRMPAAPWEAPEECARADTGDAENEGASDANDGGEEMETPEIDVMDGIVAAEDDAPKAAAPKKNGGGRKKA